MGEMGKRPRKGGSRMERSHMMIRMVLMMALLSAPFPQPGLASDIPRAAERHRAELIRVSRAVWAEASTGMPIMAAPTLLMAADKGLPTSTQGCMSGSLYVLTMASGT